MKSVKVLCTVLAGLICLMPIAGLSARGEENDKTESLADYTATLGDYPSYLNDAPPPYTGETLVVPAAGFVRQQDAGVHVRELEGEHDAVVWDSQQGTLYWNVTAPQNGLYQIGLVYMALPEKENDLEMSLYINGEIPFAQAEDTVLPRLWKNDGGVRTDALGNELSPVQVQETAWQTEYFTDKDGLAVRPLMFRLKAGDNSIALEMLSGTMALSRVLLGACEAPEPYEQVSAGYEAPSYTGAPIIIEGESADLKSTKALRPLADKSDPTVYPSDVYKQKLNYIGGGSWKQPGEKLTWIINVPEDGLYCLNFKYRQSYVRNGVSIRKLRIDGVVPFAEAESIAFPYGLRWKMLTFGGKEAKQVFLKAGKHRISLEVTLGDMAEASRRLDALVYEIGETYRQMVMITGSEPDPNRDYRLSQQIPGLEEDLQRYRTELVALSDEMEAKAGSKGGSDAVILKNLSHTIGKMLQYRYRMHEYIKDYFTNYSSISAWGYELRNMPLDLDAIILTKSGEDLKQFRSTLWERMLYSVQKFAVSFTEDYNTVSVTGATERRISLWLGWGRDQAQVLDSMIKESFTPENDIGVDIKLVNVSLIQAILSGSAPDCSLMLSRGQPVNLAIRGALQNLAEFPDYEDVVKRFAPHAAEPYTYRGGVWGLPDTQLFFMMFYRDDILRELNLNPPTTWDELLQCASVIMRANMQIGVPLTPITDMYQTETGVGSMSLYPSMLYQLGGSMYNAEQTKTTFGSSKSLQAFALFTSLYCKYKFPISYDFYNRFRTGEMPIAIASYTEYARLMAAAPEIRNRWKMAPVPGIMENGKLNNTVSDAGTACVILNVSKNKEAAWEFLKWWTGEDAQYRYASETESILGVSARHPTSNQAAFAKLGWKRQSYEQIKKQWDAVRVVPEVPGGYFTQRALENAFWTTYLGDNPREALLKWAKAADEEIARKSKEYGNQ